MLIAKTVSKKLYFKLLKILDLDLWTKRIYIEKAEIFTALLCHIKKLKNETTMGEKDFCEMTKTSTFI